MFKKRVKEEIEEIFANFEDVSKRKFSYDDLAGLPEPVQRYLRYSLKDGQESISCVRLKHAGVFRQRENQKWMQIRREEYFTTQPPAFIWYTKVKPIPFFCEVMGFITKKV